jgi:hypothetical protein
MTHQSDKSRRHHHALQREAGDILSETHADDLGESDLKFSLREFHGEFEGDFEVGPAQSFQKIADVTWDDEPAREATGEAAKTDEDSGHETAHGQRTGKTGGKDGRVTVTLGNEGMTAAIDLYPSEGDGTPLSPDLVRDSLNVKNVVYGIDSDLLRKVVREVEKTKEAKVGVVIARGSPPVAGKEGRVEFLFSEDESALERRLTNRDNVVIE